MDEKDTISTTDTLAGKEHTSLEAEPPATIKHLVWLWLLVRKRPFIGAVAVAALLATATLTSFWGKTPASMFIRSSDSLDVASDDETELTPGPPSADWEDSTTLGSLPEEPSTGGQDSSPSKVPSQPPLPDPRATSATECQLTAVQSRCTLGDTGLRVFITFYDQPTRAKIELSGTASGTVSKTILAGGSDTLDIENRRGEFFHLDVAYREQPKAVEVTLGDNPS